ncbi:MAG: hypothetical protein ACN23H_02325 [Candidatus Phytoplasma vitis]
MHILILVTLKKDILLRINENTNFLDTIESKKINYCPQITDNQQQ